MAVNDNGRAGVKGDEIRDRKVGEGGGVGFDVSCPGWLGGHRKCRRGLRSKTAAGLNATAARVGRGQSPAGR